MPNSQAGDVEALRRELADLIVQWAGKSVKDDPDGPLGAALTRAVREAAREAVSEQHLALSRRDAEGIAEAVARLNAERPGAGTLPQKTLLAICAVAVMVAALTFVLGLQVGRSGASPQAAAEPALSAAAATPFTPPVAPSAVIAPQAPAAEPGSARAATTRSAPAPARAQPARRAAPSGPAGRPAPAAPIETGGQPVTGARAVPPPAISAPTVPAATP